MATLTEQLSQVVQTNAELTDAVESELAKWQAEREGALADMQQSVSDSVQSLNNYISNARQEYPVFRTSKNQSLMDVNGTVPQFWGTSGIAGGNYQEVAVVNGNNYKNEFDEDVEQLLIKMGITKTRPYYNGYAFKVIRVTWSGIQNQAYSFNYNRLPTTIHPYLTFAAYVKLKSGNVKIYNRAVESGEWGLFGGHYKTNFHNTAHVAITHTSESGEMLLALPAVVAGHVDLSNFQNWGQFFRPSELTWD